MLSCLATSLLIRHPLHRLPLLPRQEVAVAWVEAPQIPAAPDRDKIAFMMLPEGQRKQGHEGNDQADHDRNALSPQS